MEFTPDLVEDLKRRDFTINAMAYSHATGIVDAFDGVADLKAAASAVWAMHGAFYGGCAAHFACLSVFLPSWDLRSRCHTAGDHRNRSKSDPRKQRTYPGGTDQAAFKQPAGDYETGI